MKKTLLLCGALLAFSATVASAAGINLSWNDCGTNGVTNRVFACASNAGSNAMVASVVAPQPIPRFVGIDIIMDLQTAGAVLPPWWGLDAGTGCRNTSLAMGTDVSGTPSGGSACVDYFAGQGGGGIASYTAGFAGANRARILAFWALANEGVLGTDETYMFRMTVNNLRTVGTGSCAGCTEGACIVLNLIRLVQPAGAVGGDTEVTNAANAQHVAWQGGIPNCPGATSTKSATWGQVKSLYR